MPADSMMKATVHEPVGKGPLWGHAGWQLPAYIQHVSNELRAKGSPESRAINMAVGIVRNWAHGHDGKGNAVHTDVQAAATKAMVEWEALKAKAAAQRASKSSNHATLAGDALDLASRNGHHVPGTPHEWKHGYVPLTASVAADPRNKKSKATLERLRGAEAPNVSTAHTRKVKPAKASPAFVAKVQDRTRANQNQSVSADERARARMLVKGLQKEKAQQKAAHEQATRDASNQAIHGTARPNHHLPVDQFNQARHSDARSLKPGDQYFVPAAGHAYTTGADGRVTSVGNGVAGPVQGRLLTVNRVSPKGNTMTATDHNGVSISGRVPASQKVLVTRRAPADGGRSIATTQAGAKADRQAFKPAGSTAPAGAKGNSWGTFTSGTGESLTLYRTKGNRAQFFDSKGNKVGPEQANIAPAMAWATANRYQSDLMRKSGIALPAPAVQSVANGKVTGKIDRIKAAATMYGTGSPQHKAAIAKWGPKSKAANLSVGHPAMASRASAMKALKADVLAYKAETDPAKKAALKAKVVAAATGLHVENMLPKLWGIDLSAGGARPKVDLAFDSALHPRVAAGSSTGGTFTAAGGGADTGKGPAPGQTYQSYVNGLLAESVAQTTAQAKAKADAKAALVQKRQTAAQVAAQKLLDAAAKKEAAAETAAEKKAAAEAKREAAAKLAAANKAAAAERKAAALKLAAEHKAAAAEKKAAAARVAAGKKAIAAQRANARTAVAMGKRPPTHLSADLATAHHKPGTPYHWKHGYIPLDAETAARNKKGAAMTAKLRAGNAPNPSTAHTRKVSASKPKGKLQAAQDARIRAATKENTAAHMAETKRQQGVWANRPSKAADRLTTSGTASSAPKEDPVYAESVKALDARLAKAQAEVGDTQKVHDNLPGGDNIYSPERTAMHNRILDRLMKESERMPRDRQAIILAGPSGAGKSTLLKNSGNDFGVHTDPNTRQPTNYAVVNPDDMKEHILKETGLPAEYAQHGLASNELAGLLHEESSHLAKRHQAALMDRGTNLILDGTFSGGKDKNLKKAEIMQAKGYKVTGVLIDAPGSVAINQAIARHKGKMTAPDANGHYPGRYVPIGLVAEQGQTDGARSTLFNRPARSRNAVNFEAAVQAGKFDGGAHIYDPLARNAAGNPTLAWSGG